MAHLSLAMELVMSFLGSAESFRCHKTEASEKSAHLVEPRQGTGFQALQTMCEGGTTSETLPLMARTSVPISQYLLGFRSDLCVAHCYPDTLGAGVGAAGDIVQCCKGKAGQRNVTREATNST